MPDHRHRHANDAGPGHYAKGADRRSLRIALALILAFMVAEVVTAVLANSLALFADAGHMLVDAGAIGAALWAWHLADRPASGPWTFGFKRAEILSAAGNGITLLVLSGIIVFISVQHLISPPDVHGLVVVVVAAAGIVVNLLAVWVLLGANRTKLNVEGAFQHVLTDLYGFAATVIAGVIIVTVGFDRADAIASLVVVVLMLRAAWGLLHASMRILLEAAPEAMDLGEVRSHLMEPEHVREVHDLHVWTVTSDLPAISAHIVVDDSCFWDGHAPQVLDELQSCLSGHFDVEHSTFQLEPASHFDHEPGTHP